MAKAALLEIDIVARAAQAIGEFDKVKSKAGESHNAMALGAAAAGTAILGALGAATKAAVDHEAAIFKLNQAYIDSGTGAATMAGDIGGIEQSARRTGQSTEDLISAYTKLVTATHDTAKAHRDLTIAQDLAAFKGMSVAEAASVVEKAAMGSGKALKDLGIATKDTAGHAKPAAETLTELARAVQGQADAFGDTAAGKMARYSESLDQTKVKIGEALLPALTQLLDTLAPVFDWLNKNTEVLQVLVPIAAMAAGVIIAITTAMRIWVAVQWALNIALDANPIGIIILAIGALILSIVLVVQHWEDFRGAIDAVWQALQSVWDMILTVIDAVWALVSAIPNALGGLASLGGKAWDFITTSPFAAGAPGGPTATPIYLQIVATPGDDLPETVYQALREYQRRHVRPELAPAFGPAWPR